MEKERKVEKKKMKKGMLRMIIVLSIIAAVIVFAVVFGVVPALSTTPFGVFVNNTVGKFFNVANLFVNNGMALLETAVIIFFVWALNEIVKIVIDLLIRRFSKKSTVGLSFAASSNMEASSSASFWS